MSLRHALLGLLAEHHASGYDLLKLFETSLANVWPATQSQIYGELTKLADADLITVRAEGPRGRKEYALTDAGAEELRHWLTETEPKLHARSEMLLRVFFLGVLRPDEARGYLGGIAARAERDQAALTELAGRIDWGDDNLSRYGRLALEYARRMTTLRRDWARWAADHLDTAA